MYEVIWTDAALDTLARIWTHYESLRSDITATADRIDTILALNPMGVGESREADNRLLFEFPLAIFYYIEQDTQTVQVSEISIFGKGTT